MGGKSKAPPAPVTPPSITVKSLDGKATSAEAAAEEARQRAAGTLDAPTTPSGLGTETDYSPDVGKPLFG